MLANPKPAIWRQKGRYRSAFQHHRPTLRPHDNTEKSKNLHPWLEFSKKVYFSDQVPRFCVDVFFFFKVYPCSCGQWFCVYAMEVNGCQCCLVTNIFLCSSEERFKCVMHTKIYQKCILLRRLFKFLLHRKGI